MMNMRCAGLKLCIIISLKTHGVPFWEPLFLLIRVNTYLFFWKIFPTLLKVVYMLDSQTLPLKDRVAHCRERIDQCAEIIKQLRGFIPKDFKFRFTIGTAVIANFDIEESEDWFMYSFFIAWHSYYKKELKRLEKLAA